MILEILPFSFEMAKEILKKLYDVHMEVKGSFGSSTKKKKKMPNKKSSREEIREKTQG